MGPAAGVFLAVVLLCGVASGVDVTWPPAPVGETGQTGCWNTIGLPVVLCSGTGQDGDLRPGAAWPNPRFTVNVDLNDDGDCTDPDETCDGTVTDNLTGLVWLADASCADLPHTNSSGRALWQDAFLAAAELSNGTCGLTDGSVAGDWRLPSVKELLSLLTYQFSDPPISSTAGTAQWSEGDPFSGVETYYYWSSTSFVVLPDEAWAMSLDWDGMIFTNPKTDAEHVWPVRDGPALHRDVGWPPAPVGRTGQTGCWNEIGLPLVPCDGTGQDGDLRPGAAWPTPRFTANVDLNDDGDCQDPGETCDGTVTDNLTGLVWLADASCGDLPYQSPWQEALEAAAELSSGTCGLTDGSVAGDWRLPSVNELLSLMDYQYDAPSLPNTAGTAQWSEGDPFSGALSSAYWSSTTLISQTNQAWWGAYFYGSQGACDKSHAGTGTPAVWLVRDGPALFADGFGPGDARRWSAQQP